MLSTMISFLRVKLCYKKNQIVKNHLIISPGTYKNYFQGRGDFMCLSTFKGECNIYCKYILEESA